VGGAYRPLREPIYNLLACVFSFGHLALRLSLYYLVKCRSRNLTIDNNEFILGSACVSRCGLAASQSANNESIDRQYYRY